jgi:hypothetical protein
MKRILLLIFVNCSVVALLAFGPSVKSILLHSAILLTQNNVLAVGEATPAATESASVKELPAVHILPDNPLYFLKTIKEKVQLFFTRNTSDEVDLLLGFAQKRLAEALKVAEKGKVHISEKLFEAFGRDIESAEEKIRQARARGEKTYHLLSELQKTVAYQKSVVEELQGQAEFLGSFLVEVDQNLASPSAEQVEHVKMSPSPKKGLGVFDWLKSLFGKKEILKPLVE